MVMFAATWVEAGFAMRAGIVGIHVFLYAQLISANSAENSLLVKFYLWPNIMLMIGFFFMAGKARIILVAAFEFDGDNI
jgi:hypothetical protein